jgi:Dyp-type peroxidase family
MWVGRVREFILVAALWALPAAAVLGLAHGVAWYVNQAWPARTVPPSGPPRPPNGFLPVDSPQILFPMLLGLAAAVLVCGIILWMMDRPLQKLRESLTPKYGAKIRDARVRDAADPFRRIPPFRLDPEKPAAGFALGLDGVIKALTSLGLRIIRIVAPNARIWPIPMRFVTRFDDVSAVLGNGGVFQVPYRDDMEDLGRGTNFVLGMDGAEHAAARVILDGVMGKLAHPDDHTRVANRAREVANSLVEQAQGRMDVVADLIRRTAAETCIEYFGLDAPDPDSLADWTMGINRLVFADPFGAPKTREQALQAARLFRGVAERSLEIGARRPSANTLVTRLLALEKAGQMTRNETLIFLTGSATGMIPTTTIGMTAIIEELQSWPMWWTEARRLASTIQDSEAGDARAERNRLQDILMEAARLSPTLFPGQFRLVGRNAVIAPGTLRAARVRTDDLLLVSTAAALRDGRRFKRPNAFNPDRPKAEKDAALLMFGSGPHRCVSLHVAIAVMVEIAIALFSREDLAPAAGDAGKVRFAGPYPRSLEMTWKPEGPVAGQQMVVIAAPLPALADIDALTRGLKNLQDAGGRDDLERTGIVHFASFSVVDLHRDPQDFVWPGKKKDQEFWLVGDLNFDGAFETGLARIAAEMRGWLGTFEKADPSIKTPEDLARFFRKHALDIRATPWGSTGLQYQGSIGLPVSDIRRQKELADFVRDVADHLNRRGSLEDRDPVRKAGSAPDAVQILDTVRRLIRKDPEISLLAQKRPAIRELVNRGEAFQSFLLRPLSKRLAFSDYRSGKGWASPPLGQIFSAALADRDRIAVLATLLVLAVAITTTLKVVASGAAYPLTILMTAVSSLVWVSAITGLAALLLIGVFLVLLVGHEAAERTDVSVSAPNRVEEVEAFENGPECAQNPMLSVTWVKPGLFRRYTLALYLWIIRMLVTTALRQGNLGRMVSVHFARWVKPAGSDAYLFLSNYDGSWTSYLEDFSALASQGVNLAWGNSRGFPTGSLMINAGCTDSDSFKRFAKRSMRPTHFWYSGYPTLTLENTRRNALIHDGLLRAANATEAQDWLDLLASVKRPEKEIETEEVQTLVLRGLGSMPVMQCGLVSLPPGADLAGWTAQLARSVNFGNQDPDPQRWHHQLVGGAFGLRSGPMPDRPEVALFVAFTASGLGKMGIPGPQDGLGMAGFLAPFYQGMSSRERILRDGGPSRPSKWEWSDSLWTGAPAKRDAVDAVLLAYGMTPADCDNAIRIQAAMYGLKLVKSLTSPARPVMHGGLRSEPFGFADGISNPVMKGLRGDSGSPHDQVEAGEILLGYPHNRPGKAPTCALPADLDPLHILPAVLGDAPVETATEYTRYPAFGRESGAASDHDFGRNGTFLVVRQLEQDVAGFIKYTEEAARGLAACPGMSRASADWVAAKMVGRWRDGSPMALYPDAQPRKPDPTNDFGYAGIDPRGFACPLGSHVRRSNPRDSLISDQPKDGSHVSSHRILRRGRAYRDTDGKGNQSEGLIFLAACADLERQFEFVQQTWIGDPSFHGLTGESDPAVDSDGRLQDLSLPDGRTVRRLKGIPDFVTVRGGGYFFMPSRSALHYLAYRSRRLAGTVNPPSAPGSRKRSASPSPTGEPA